MRKQVDRKSTRLNSSHLVISYAVFCLKKKKKTKEKQQNQRTVEYVTLHRLGLMVSQCQPVLRCGSTPSVVVVVFFFFFFFFFNDTATTEIYTLSLHDALPI